MPARFPAAWLLFALPFASSGVIAHVRPLRELSSRHNLMTTCVGLFGLVAFITGMVGIVPPGWASVAVFGGGVLAGFAMFWIPHRGRDDGSGGDDWRRPKPPPDEPPPPPSGDPLVDWELFDRLRAQWERRPVGTH